jgi:hypothetical protein
MAILGQSPIRVTQRYTHVVTPTGRHKRMGKPYGDDCTGK